MNWEWAREQMKDGKKVRRTCWALNMFMKKVKGGSFSLFLQAGDTETDLGISNIRPSRGKKWDRLVASDRGVQDWKIFTGGK